MGLFDAMRRLRSSILAPSLIVFLLVSLSAASWARTWTGSVVLWLLSGVIALVLFAALLRDDG